MIFVACHAPFKNTMIDVPQDPIRDDGWVLQSFQQGEAGLYIEHARRGVELAAANPEALLIFSGGYTRREGGPRWSEAATYHAIARHFHWWQMPDVEPRAVEEDYSRDSFENLLFSICRFHEITGRYPRQVVAVSWEFKRQRFYTHAEALRLPQECFHFEGCGEPIDLASALRNESATQQAFVGNPYGSAGALRQKRETRNPFGRSHPFRSLPGLREFFNFMEQPASPSVLFPGRLPWE
jgi:hypothetical protein